MNDPIIVMDKAGLEALPVGAQVQVGGRTYVRSEDGFKAAFSTPEFTAKYIATKAPLTVLNPERLGPFVAVGDTVQIVHRFCDGTASRYDGQAGTLTRINRGWGQPYEVAVPKMGGGARLISVTTVAEVRPEPLTESLAELLPFYIKDADALDELPHGSVVTVLHTGFYPRSKIHDAWRLPPLGDDYTFETKGLVAEYGAMVVSLGAGEFLPEDAPRFD